MPRKIDRERVSIWIQLPTYLTALTAVGALIFTGLSLSATNQQTSLSQQGQASDRFGKAVEQLANADSIQSRLGGIYSLEHLMRDAPADQSVTVELLSAFVRERGGRIGSNDTIFRTCALTTSIDIQAALSVLGRRDPARDGGARIDLNRTCLNNVDLIGLNFAGANLEHADFATADLTRINLAGAKLADSNLSPVILREANLTGADLKRANLTRSDLENANLAGSQMRESDLEDAHFEGANLAGVQAENADTNGARFERAQTDHSVGIR